MQRALLSLLLVNANTVVSTDTIREALWGDDQPESGLKALRFHVSKLRSAIDVELSGERPIVTQSPGYKVVVGEDDFDVVRFESKLNAARAVIEAHPAHAVELIEEALGVWRGRAYEEFQYSDWAVGEVARLDELRLSALEDRIAAELALGRHFDLTGELEALAAEHPFRERIAGMLMLAQYRSGRQRDALRSFQFLRTRLAEEVGANPTAEIAALEQRIIEQDPKLDVAVSTERRPRQPVRGYELREQVGSGRIGRVFRAYDRSAGREVALKVIPPDLAAEPSFIQRFEADARLLTRLEHPHIVTTYDRWREGDSAYAVTRWIRGGSLDDRLQRDPLIEAESLSLLERIGAALAYAHQRGVTHLDLRPANVMLDDDGTPFVADFGEAALLLAARGPQALAGMPNAAPEQRVGETAGVATDIWMMALLAKDVLRARSTETPPGAEAYLAEVLAAGPELRPGSVDRFMERLLEELGEGGPSVAISGANPYRGLAAFDEADAGLFFGRDDVVERVVKRLASGEPDHRFLALVGPSGSGKSSLARAGVLPALRRGDLPGAESWLIGSMMPGSDPSASLAAAIASVTALSLDDITMRLGRGVEGIHDAVRHALPDGSWELFLLIDQFEELFTQSSLDGRRSFIESMVHALRHPHSQLRVLVTLRADFYDRPLHFSELGEMVQRRTETVLPLAAAGLEEAIARPAEQAGLVVETGLVGQVVAEISDQPGALPLFQFAMTELYDECQQSGALTVDGYERIGGVSGALTKRADETLAALDSQDQATARRLLLELVELGEGTEDTRRRVPLSELERHSDSGAEKVVATLGEARLVQFDRDPVTRAPTVEVAHEALIREWPQLRRWLDESRDELRAARRIAEASNEWNRSGRDPSFLLSGSRLAAAEGISGPAIDEFLEASRKTAARQKRRNALAVGSLSVLTILLAVVSVLALLTSRRADAAAVSAEASKAEAEQAANQAAIDAAAARDSAEAADAAKLEAETAKVESLARTALATRDSDPALALALALEADAQGSTSLTQMAVLETVESFSGHRGTALAPLLGFRGTVWSAALDEAGTTMFTAPDDERGVQQWNLADGSRIDWDELHDRSLREIALTADGTRLVTASLDGLVKVWDTVSQKNLLTLEGHGAQVWAVDLDQAEARIVSGGAGGTARLWDLESGEALVVLTTQEAAGQVWTVRFSPDGTSVATGSEDGVIRIWHAATGDLMDEIEAHDAAVQDLVWLDGGSRLASAGDDGDAVVWDLESGSAVTKRFSHNTGLRTIAVSADERFLATAGVDGVVHLWEIAKERRLVAMDGHSGLVWDVVFNPEGDTLYSTGTDGSVRQWDVAPAPGNLALSDHIPAKPPSFAIGARGIAVHPSGEFFTAALRELPVTSFDLDTGAIVAELPPEEGIHTQYVAWSSEGHRLAVGRIQDGVVRVYGRDGSEVAVLETGNSIRGLAFSHDDAVVIAGTDAAGVHVFDAATGETIRVIDLGEEVAARWVTVLDASRIAVGDGDGFLSVWDFTTGERLALIEAHENEVRSMGLNAAGTVLATGGGDGVIRLWSTADYSQIEEWRAHGAGVRGVEWRPDGTVLASAGEDSTVALWDTSSYDLLVRYERQTRPVWGLAWTPDGTKLISGSEDGSILVRDLGAGPADWCERLGRYLDPNVALAEFIGDRPTACS